MEKKIQIGSVIAPFPLLIITWFRFKNNFSIADFQVYLSVLSAAGSMWYTF
jgi:hypothetical protein